MRAFIAIPRDADHRNELMASRRFCECEFYIVGRPGETVEQLAKMAPHGATIITEDGEWNPPTDSESLAAQSGDRVDVSSWCEQKRTPKRGDIAAITCFFNPAGYGNLRRNYDLFAAHLNQCGVPLFACELAHDDNPHTIPRARQVRAKSRLFHKENLLNLALEIVPDRFTKIAFVDCDFIFSRSDWADLASEMLDDFPAVQPCATVADMAEDGTIERTRATVAAKGPAPENRPGGCWAIRREILDAAGGLFDKCVVGSGDMVHTHVGFLGNFNHPFLWNYSQGVRIEAKQWARNVFGAVQGRIAAAPVEALHLFHGTIESRQYRSRDRLMNDIDPDTWLTYNDDNVLEWTANADPEVVAGVNSYFESRHEDGVANRNHKC